MQPATLSDMPIKSKQVNARIPEDMLRVIDEYAEREDRPRSLMIRRLLAEAIAARQRKAER